ncbi:MAG: hypothetical protein ACRERD_23870 [Candidatus Binatia bacterium]
MSTQVVLTLPNEIYHRAERLAQLIHRDVADILADTLALSLPPLSPQPETVRPVTELADEDILALTELQMDAKQDRRLSTLLEKQQAGDLTDADRPELLALMQLYQEGLVRKAQALHEAVRRGLRKPLDP